MNWESPGTLAGRASLTGFIASPGFAFLAQILLLYSQRITI
jgi:hypothetical protein